MDNITQQKPGHRVQTAASPCTGTGHCMWGAVQCTALAQPHPRRETPCAM
jgi:hypothetical protein